MDEERFDAIAYFLFESISKRTRRRYGRFDFDVKSKCQDSVLQKVGVKIELLS